MGSNSRGKDGEGSSGKDDDEYEQEMNFVPSEILFINSNMNTNGFVAPFVMQQVPMSAMQRPGMIAQSEPTQSLMQNRYVETVVHERFKNVRITWNHGGTNVFIAGSWNDRETAEAMQNVGQNQFVIDKTLPISIYYYGFIVDGHWRHAPEFPCFDNSGHVYNILDLQDYIPQTAENDSKDPQSPPSSYDNIFLSEDDFNKPPPQLPPQIPVTITQTQEASTSNTDQVSSFTHVDLNHLYVHKSDDDQFVALRSTHRFKHKFVTTLLYKSLDRKR